MWFRVPISRDRLMVRTACRCVCPEQVTLRPPISTDRNATDDSSGLITRAVLCAFPYVREWDTVLCATSRHGCQTFQDRTFLSVAFFIFLYIPCDIYHGLNPQGVILKVPSLTWLPSNGESDSCVAPVPVCTLIP